MNPCSNCPYVTSSLTRRWVCLFEQVWTLSSVRITHITCYWKLFLVYHIQALCQSWLCKANHAYILRILCYNVSLVTWTVVSLITAKFKLLIFSISGFALSYAANMSTLMILYDFCLSPAISKSKSIVTCVFVSAERVYRAVARKRSLYIRLSRSNCITTIVHVILLSS
jgi:hypothetical protein